MAGKNRNNARLYEELLKENAELRQKKQILKFSENKRKQAEKLLRIQRDLALTLSSTTTLRDAGYQILSAASQIDSIDSGGVYLVDRSTGLSLIAYQGHPLEFIKTVTRMGPDSYQAKVTLEGKKLYTNYKKIIRDLDEKAILEETIKGVAIIPINYEGEIMAVLLLASHTNEKFLPPTRKAIETLAAEMGGAIARIKAQETLQDSEEKYRELIESSNDGIYLLYKRKFHLVNNTFKEMFGVTLEDVRSSEFDFMHLVSPKSKDFIEERTRKLNQGEELPPRYEFIGVSKDGKEIELDVSVSYVKYKDTIAVQGIIRDITERKQLERQLQQAQKMEAVGKLAGGMAHDFNNMLQAISGYVQLMQRGIKPEHTQKYLGEIESVVARAADLVGRLLTFSRVTESKLTPVSLNNEVTQAAKILERTIPKIIQIRTILTSDLWLINGNANQFQQILLNLGTNAKDAIPGNGKIEIETENIILDETYCKVHLGLKPGKYVVLKFSDTGVGMTKEVMARIFEPFYTTKKVGKGTGLGLCLVYGIVEAHRGKIICYSEPDLGTSFKIYLPALQSSNYQPAELKKPDKKIARGTETIMMVDDEKDILAVGAEILEQYGYSVLTAENGKQALEVFARHKDRVDLVVLDINMPEMGGPVCMKELLKLKPSLKILVASGYLIKDQLKHNIKHGNTEFITKPYRLEDLLEKIRIILDQKK